MTAANSPFLLATIVAGEWFLSRYFKLGDGHANPASTKKMLAFLLAGSLTALTGAFAVGMNFVPPSSFLLKSVIGGIAVLQVGYLVTDLRAKGPLKYFFFTACGFVFAVLIAPLFFGGEDFERFSIVISLLFCAYFAAMVYAFRAILIRE